MDGSVRPRRSPRVLILEPNLGACDLVVEVIGSIGCDIVGPCRTLGAASKRVQSETIDGAVLEIKVGGSFSFDLASQLLGKGAAIIFFSRAPACLLPADLRREPLLIKPEGISRLADVATAAFSRR